MNPRRSSWQSPLGSVGVSAFARLERDQTADVCVIGAGMAGLLTALELAERAGRVVRPDDGEARRGEHLLGGGALLRGTA